MRQPARHSEEGSPATHQMVPASGREEIDMVSMDTVPHQTAVLSTVKPLTTREPPTADISRTNPHPVARATAGLRPLREKHTAVYSKLILQTVTVFGRELPPLPEKA